MTEKQYNVTCERIEELLKVVGNETSQEDKNFIELDFLSDLVADYEDLHYPIITPSLPDVIKLRMFEMNLTQAKLAELIGVSAPRVSEFITGKSEPTLKLAREISKKLKIDASIVLGV